MMYRALIRSVETTYLFGYASTCTTNTTPPPQPLLPWVGFSFLSSVRMPSFYHHQYRSYHLFISLYHLSTIFHPYNHPISLPRVLRHHSLPSSPAPPSTTATTLYHCHTLVTILTPPLATSASTNTCNHDHHRYPPLHHITTCI